jgi:hypothetical protein
MFIIAGGVVADSDLDLLTELLTVIDRQLDVILDDWQDASEADEFGYFDRAEHITGLGFVACQAYMTATYGFLNMPKSTAVAAGPSHRTGQRVVAIINHAANYWKHHEEWHLDRNQANQDRIRAAFDAVGFPVDLDYPLSGVLTELVDPQPAAFMPLVPMLAAWRDDIRRVPQ